MNRKRREMFKHNFKKSNDQIFDMEKINKILIALFIMIIFSISFSVMTFINTLNNNPAPINASAISLQIAEELEPKFTDLHNSLNDINNSLWLIPNK
jgi:hypothetical protein